MISQGDMILALAVVLALLSGQGHSEQVGISVELNKRDDGEVGASLYVANATKQLFLNSSLSLRIDAFIDQSKRLISASGYVKETNRNEAIELTCDAASKDREIQECKLSKEAELSAKDEEIKRWSFLCPDEDKNLLSIASGDDAGYEKIFFREKRTKVADFLIVDGHTYKESYAGVAQLHSEMKQRCNFWVSDDGNVYKGIGWNEYNYYYNGGLGSKSLIIGFIKKDSDSPPSDAALKSFKEVVRTAICSNVLSPHYSVIPFYLINDYFNTSNKSFEKNGMTEWVGYKRNLDFLIPSDEKEAQPIVSKLEWSGGSPYEYDLKNSSPIDYLIVTDFRERCFLNCRNYLKSMNNYIGLSEANFLLGEDGRAYENRGWEIPLPDFTEEKEVALVIFLGTFHNYAPNKRIFDALEDLIEEGLRLGKLSPTFKIVAVETLDSNLSMDDGKYLKEEIRKHPRFSETL